MSDEILRLLKMIAIRQEISDIKNSGFQPSLVVGGFKHTHGRWPTAEEKAQWVSDLEKELETLENR